MAFKPGQSGHPQGRDKGRKNKRHEYFDSKTPELQRKLFEMAIGGDIAALKIIADRIWPKCRSEATPIFVRTKENASLAERGQSLIDATMSGEISADVVRDVLTALYGQARLVEASEIEDRLKALENHKERPPWEAHPAKPKRVRRPLLV